MTREEFVRQYAKESGVSVEWAGLGIIEFGGTIRTAMPCACGDDSCRGWAMLSANAIHDHLFFRAPEALREAYRRALSGEGK